MKRRGNVVWAFRVNEIIAQWIGMQMGMHNFYLPIEKDRVRTPPPPYDAKDPTPQKEDECQVDGCLFRTICQAVIWLIGIVLAIVWYTLVSFHV